MTYNEYSLSGIHLPENKNLISLLKKLSFIISFFILVISGVIFFGWIVNISLFKSLFFNSQPIPFVSVTAFALASTALLLEEMLGPIAGPNKLSKKIQRLYFWASVFCGATVTLIGVMQMMGYFVSNNVGFDKILNNNLGEKQAFANTGVCIFLFGLSLLISHIKASHRFHAVHFFALNALVISSITILGYMYHLVFAFQYSQIARLPLNTAIIVFFVSIALSLRWPARGFIGMFTTDSVSSKFSLSVLCLKVLLIYFLGIAVMVGSQMGIYNPYEALAIFAVLMTVLSLVMTWFNIKLLYKFELERFIMKEELRIHNIDLQLGNEELSDKMKRLKETNEEYSKKLDSRDKYEDVINSMG